MKTKRHGTTCHPHGRTIDVVSDYPEWTAWAVAALRAAAEKEIAEAEAYGGMRFVEESKS